MAAALPTGPVARRAALPAGAPPPAALPAEVAR